LIDSNGREIKIWITRLLCKKTCSQLVKLLENSTEVHQVKNTEISLTPAAILSEEYNQAKEKPSDPTPKKKADMDLVQNNTVQMCHSIEINQGSLWQIIFHMKDRTNVKLSVNRQGVHRILSTLLNQSNQANWAISLNAQWLKN
tara:strand:+ start:150 stop:581 length:432 start_codon:yes stop_codon:yes gene_type:complete